MMRKVLIGLAAVALATGVSTLNASAHHGGGGSAMSMHGGGPYVSKGSKLRSAGPRHFKEPRAYGFHRERFGYGERYRHRPHYRYGYRGGYGGSCWTSVWTPDGWRSQWVCGPSRPYYGYRYGHYHRPFYGPRYGHYRPLHGPRYGRH